MDANYYKKYEPIFGAWKIKRKLGEGNFGAVFEIEREDFGTVYHSALKAITIPKNQSELDSLLDDGMDATGATQYLEQFVEKIVGEFVLMSKLKGNSHIVSYEDHQVIKHKDGIGWDILIRMELLTPLMTHMKTTSVTKRDVIQLGIDMCRALELCQKYNIIHRDIKPENIFIADSGDFKLGDFGIAKEVEKTQSGLTKTGTQTYMAPEVYKGQPYGSSVDIYSLGIVLYRLLNHNRAPFMPQYPEPISYSDRERALIMRMGGHKFPMPSGVADSRLAEIALKACSFKPEDRYSSPTQMREDLEAILYTEGEGILMFPNGDTLDIKSVEYVSNSKAPNATEIMGNEDTEVMDDDATEIMEKAQKKFTSPKTKSASSKKKIVKIVAPIICAGLVVGGGAYYFNNKPAKTEQCMVMTQNELNSPIEFTVSGTISDSDYNKIESRLEAYGCKYYMDKEKNLVAMGKNDLGSNNQEILATIHMLLGQGKICVSDTKKKSASALEKSDFEKAEFITEGNSASYANIVYKSESKEKVNSLVKDISENSEDKKAAVFIDENVRYSVNVTEAFKDDKLVIKGDYDGKSMASVLASALTTNVYAADDTLSAKYVRLIISIINDGELSQSYDVIIDEKYGIKVEAVTPEPTVAATKEPEMTEKPEQVAVPKNESNNKTQSGGAASSKNSSSTADTQKKSVQQAPTQQKPAEEAPVQQKPVQQEPIQQAPVQQETTTNEDVPEIFDPSFD